MRKSGTAMTKSSFFAALVLTTAVACGRADLEAIELSNQADKDKSANLDASISKYEQATQLDPKNFRITYKLGQAYVQKEKWDAAATTMAKASKLAPTFANYKLWQGIALARQVTKAVPGATWADAKGPLEESVKLDPNLAEGHFELADVLLHLDDEAGAITSYGRAIAARPDKAEYYAPLADLYKRLGFLDQAEAVLKEGLSFAKPEDKNTFVLQTHLGDTYDRKAQAGPALVAYEAARKSCGDCKEPGQGIAFFNLGVAYAQAGKKGEAVAQLQSFNRMICKTGSGARYAAQCSQAMQITQGMGETLK